MPKIKHTKNELKAQREALRRFQRFLPMLQLKKQQLQAEIQTVESRLNDTVQRENTIYADLEPWLPLFSTSADTHLPAPDGIPCPTLADLLTVESIDTDEGNIAGVNIPVLKNVVFAKKDVDLFHTPSWFDEALQTMEQLVQLRIERDFLEKQKALLAEELRTTSQRVNLFEKVKIPECSENIRIIKIFLGDEQTAGVVRAKTAKAKAAVYEASL